MQTAGDLVIRRVKLAARMQLGEHHLHRRHALARGRVHHVYGDAAAVIDHSDGVVEMNGDVNTRCVPGENLIDRVVDDLIDEMVQALLAVRADVHRRTKPHGLKSFENLDVVACVGALRVGSLAFRLIVLHIEKCCIRGCCLFRCHEAPVGLESIRKFDCRSPPQATQNKVQLRAAYRSFS